MVNLTNATNFLHIFKCQMCEYFLWEISWLNKVIKIDLETGSKESLKTHFNFFSDTFGSIWIKPGRKIDTSTHAWIKNFCPIRFYQGSVTTKVRFKKNVKT